MHLMKIHLTQYLARGICSLCRPGLAVPGKRSPYNCKTGVYQFVISWPGGCYGIRFLLFGGSMA